MFAPIIIRKWMAQPDMTAPEIFIVSGSPGEGQSLAEYWNAGADEAIATGVQWIFFLEPGLELSTNAFVSAAPALTVYDAVWGSMSVDGVVPKASTFTCDDPLNAWHMALVWWVGRSHFVRTAVALKTRFDTEKEGGWFADYLIRIWQSNKCLKTAQAFVSGKKDLPELASEDRRFICDFLSHNPQFISFDYGDQTIRLPYSGKNPTVERNQLRGVFFEQRDLEGLRSVVEPGAVIVDVGANTGNHTVFFAKVLNAAKIIVIEPNPETVCFLKVTIAANDLRQVDVSRLGIGVGETEGELYLAPGRRGHLGTVRLEAEGDVVIRVCPLDQLITEPVDFIKIDVEGMEIEVLNGARKLFKKEQPVVLIEVQDQNTTTFLAIIKELGYRIERIFADHGYANYLIMPEGKP